MRNLVDAVYSGTEWTTTGYLTEEEPPEGVVERTALNTGVPSGTTLNTGWEPGDFYGFTDGAVYTAYQIDCTYPMEFPIGDAGKTIKFKNCLITDGGVYWTVLNTRGVKIIFEDCTFQGVGAANAANDALLNGNDLTLIRCNIYGGGDGIKIGSRNIITDCFIHSMYVTGESHNDGIQSLGTAGNGTEGSGLTMTGTTIDASNGATCITLSTGSADEMRDILVEGNLFYCNGVSVNGGYQSGVDNPAKVSNIIYRDNWVKYPSSTPVLVSVDSPVVATGTRWFNGPNAGELV